MVVEKILTQKPSQSTDCSGITLDSRLGNKSDIFHHNNVNMSQTSFGHISTNFSTIPTVLGPA